MPFRPSPGLQVVALTICFVLAPTTARAVQAEPVRFSYEAFADCPSADDFLFAVALDGGLVMRSDAADARTFAVTLARKALVVAGRLVVRGTDGPEAVRTIDGSRCEDVARSLAVLMALALEPRPGGPPPLPPEAPPIEQAPAPDPPPVEVAPSIERWRVGLSAAGMLGTGVGPGVLGSLAVYAEVAHDAVGAFAPSLRVGFETTATSTWTGAAFQSAPQVTFSRQVGRLDVCPLRFSSRQDWTRDVFSGDVCARLDAGVLDSGPYPSVAHPWVAAGGFLRVRSLFGPFFVDLEGGAVAPFFRERFYFEPNEQVFEVPSVAATGGVGLGGYFL